MVDVVIMLFLRYCVGMPGKILNVTKIKCKREKSTKISYTSWATTNHGERSIQCSSRYDHTGNDPATLKKKATNSAFALILEPR